MQATVIIPTFNRAQRLADLLETLTTQSTSALARVVVCDDGSTDNTAEVVRSYATRLPLVYRHQENLGFRAGTARNMGLDEAVSEIAIFVDDDVVVASDFVAAHLDAHSQGDGPVLALGFRYRTFSAPELPLRSVSMQRGTPDDRSEILGPSGQKIAEQERPWIHVYSCNLSVRVTSALGPMRFHAGFRGWGMEDTEFGYRAYKNGYRIVAAEGAPVLHVEDKHPRDPFRCEERDLSANYDSYVRNAVYFMDLYPEDSALRAWVESDLRWYVRDASGLHWIKNGYANDVTKVIHGCRMDQQEHMRQEQVRSSSEFLRATT